MLRTILGPIKKPHDKPSEAAHSAASERVRVAKMSKPTTKAPATISNVSPMVSGLSCTARPTRTPATTEAQRNATAAFRSTRGAGDSANVALHLGSNGRPHSGQRSLCIAARGYRQAKQYIPSHRRFDALTPPRIRQLIQSFSRTHADQFPRRADGLSVHQQFNHAVGTLAKLIK